MLLPSGSSTNAALPTQAGRPVFGSACLEGGGVEGFDLSPTRLGIFRTRLNQYSYRDRRATVQTALAMHQEATVRIISTPTAGMVRVVSLDRVPLSRPLAPDASSSQTMATMLQPSRPAASWSG
jgi:hypothetical protein